MQVIQIKDVCKAFDQLQVLNNSKRQTTRLG